MGLLTYFPAKARGLLSGERPPAASQMQAAQLFAQIPVPVPIPGGRGMPFPIPLPPWLQRDRDDDPPIVPPDRATPRRKSEERCEWEYERNMDLCRGRYLPKFRGQFGRCASGAMDVYKECLAGRPEPPFDVEDYADWGN